MDIIEAVAQIESELEQIELKEQANQQEQAKIERRILDLETELQQQQQQRNKIDEEALKLYTQGEELRAKLDKLKRIAHLSQEFFELYTECQDNQDLLDTLYSSFSTASIEDTKQAVLNSPILNRQLAKSEEPEINRNNDYSQYSISIDDIKKALPNAEKIYQQLVAGYLEEYKTYQNYIVDGLDLIWYAVAFIAFGRPSYRKMGFKYHPDLDGSQRAMQLINTAWSISQNFLGNSPTTDDNVNTN